jgi:hypothetical protein
LEAFQAGIDQGQILLILDIPTYMVENIVQLIKTTHMEAEIGVIKPA